MSSLTSGNLVAGKRYYLKANVFPGATGAGLALGAATNDDQRVDAWLAYQARAATEAAREEFENEGLADVGSAIQEFERGGVNSFLHITDAHAF